MFGFRRALFAIALLVGFESSCRKRRVDVPALTPPPSVPSEQSHPATATPVRAPDSPPTSNAPSKDEPRFQVNRPPQSVEPQQQPQSPPPRRSSKPSESNSVAQPPQPQVNQSPSDRLPRLGDVLSPDQERQYNTAIEESLNRTQNSLSKITRYHLTKEQQAVVAQIQSFVQQAQAARKSSLAAARSLAERADVLAKDLAGSLR